VNGRLQVGVATFDITPAAGVAMSGFAARTRPSVGMHDPLTARAIAFSLADGSASETVPPDQHTRSALVVVADLLALSVGQAMVLRSRISHLTGVAAESVVVMVTHTHAGPHVTPDGLGPGQDRAVIAAVEDGIVGAAVRAWNTRVPARLGHGLGKEHTVAHNRRHAGGTIDPTVTVIRVDTEHGDPLAVVFSYSCHPTVLGPANLLFSADWPGFARSHVEAAFPGATAIFLQGCCGDINTGHSPHASMALNAIEGRTFERAALLGQLVADVVLNVARDIQPVEDARLAASSVETPMKFSPPLSRPELELLRAQSERERQHDQRPDRAVVLRAQQLWAQRAIHHEFPPAPTAVLTAIAVGELDIVTLPGEPFVGLALELRARLADRALLVVGYANGVPGYVPYPPDEYRYGGYEVREAHFFYEQGQCFAADCGPELVDAAAAAVLALPSG
jgi:neutral ceramidase